MIPYGHQSINEDDIGAVEAVLRGEWLTQGPAVEEFEEALAAACGASHAVAFNSGTAALHAALVAGEVGPGDTVETSPLSFVASANCPRYVGADVAFVDIDPETLNLDVEHAGGGDVLVAVHYSGLPADLTRLSRRPRLVVEDAAQALGASTPDGPVGNSAHSDMCTFSFHPVKTITTGEGGAVTTNSATLAERLRTFRSHGVMRRPDVAPWFYDVEGLGWNYRLTDMQAALGRSQLRRVDAFVARRHELDLRYRERLAGADLVLPPEAPPGWRSAHHLFAVRTPQRGELHTVLRDSGIGSQVHFIPIHLHKAYAALGFEPGAFPAAEQAYEQLLSLPLFVDLTEADQDRVIEVVQKVVG